MNLPAPREPPTGAVDAKRPAETDPGDIDRQTQGAPRSVTRKQLDDIFGDVLPSVTSDELDDERDRAGGDDRDSWYRDNRPPHHG